MRTDRKFDISGLKFDKRLIEMNYKNKSLTPDEYTSYLSALPDMESNAEAVRLTDAPVEEVTEQVSEAAAPVMASETIGATPVTTTTTGFGTGDSGDSSGGSNPPPFGSGY